VTTAPESVAEALENAAHALEGAANALRDLDDPREQVAVELEKLASALENAPDAREPLADALRNGATEADENAVLKELGVGGVLSSAAAELSKDETDPREAAAGALNVLIAAVEELPDAREPLAGALETVAGALRALSRPPAFWRVKSRSWVDGWNGEQIFRDVMFVTSLHGFALLDGRLDEPSLLETDDGGETWHVAYTEHSSPNAAVDFVDPLRGVAVNLTPKSGSNFRRGIALTGDGGGTWDDVLENSGTNGTLNDVAYVTPDGAGVVAVGKSGTILYSTDGGVTWDEPFDADPTTPKPPKPSTRNLRSVAFAPGAASPSTSTGVAVGDAATIGYTIDGGSPLSGASPQGAGPGPGEDLVTAVPQSTNLQERFR